MSTNKKVLFFLFSILILVCGFYASYYNKSRNTLVINYQNIQSIKLYSIKGFEKGETAGDISQSGQEIKLEKGKYVVQYDAVDGYEDSIVELDFSEKRQVINLDPNYDTLRLDAILKKELKTIHGSLKNELPNIDVYDVRQGRLYKKGDWYGTVLIYKGSDLFNSDSLRVVMKKENGKWVIKTNPPSISLNKYSYPDVPEDILRDVNAIPSPKLGR